MPPIEGGEYLAEYLNELGIARAGMQPLTYQEIQAWTQLTGLELTPMETTTLRELSESYVVQIAKAAKADCPAPYDSRSLSERRQSGSAVFRKLFEEAQNG